jgi:hypothetical protein
MQELHKTVLKSYEDEDVTALSHAFNIWAEYIKSTCGKKMSGWKMISERDPIVTDQGLINAVFKDPLNPSSTNRY